MKKGFLLIGLLVITASCFAGTANTSSSGVTCNCSSSQSLCKAKGSFTSCCTCCTPPASCGASTSFGLSSCICETVPADALTVHPVLFEDLLTYMEAHSIPTSEFSDELYTMIPANQVAQLRRDGKPIVVADEKIRHFNTSCLSLFISLSQTEQVLVNNWIISH